MAEYFKSWKKGYDPQLILAEVKKSRISHDHNSVTFDSILLSYWLPILNSAIESDIESPFIKNECIHWAIANPSNSLQDKTEFIEKCNAAFSAHFFNFSNPTSKYFVFFEITYNGPKMFSSLFFDSTKIKWGAAESNPFMKKARKERAKLAKNRQYFSDDTLESMTPIIVEVTASCPSHAFEIAINAIDLVRGLLNLAVNVEYKISGSPITTIHSINNFRLGPEHSVHNSDGTLAINNLWKEAFWAHQRKSVKWTNSPDDLRRLIRSEWKKICSHKFKKFISSGLIRYCRSLDNHDPKSVLLELWATLEYLMCAQNDRQEKLVGRIERLFSDNKVARQVSLHLRDRRNITAHSSTDLQNEEVNPIIFQAEYIVSEMIRFIIEDGKYFESDKEIAEYLDINTDARKRSREIKIRQHFGQMEKRKIKILES
jgi:hypothetical protein